MKLFFDIEGFVFIVGLDEDVIEYAVAKKYAESAGLQVTKGDDHEFHVTGRDYIKKVFQLPYTLKPVSVLELGAFVQGACEDAGFSEAQRLDLRRTVEGHLEHLVGDTTVNPREVKRYINLYTLQMLVNPTLNRNAVLALQTIAFRQAWRKTVEEELLAFREQYLDAVLQRLALGADNWARSGLYREIEAFPPDFLAYVGEGAPGHELLRVDDLKVYLSVRESVRAASNPALRQALNALAQLRSRLQATQAEDVGLVAEEIMSKLVSVEGQVASSAGGSTEGREALDALRHISDNTATRLLPMESKQRGESVYQALIVELTDDVSALAKRLGACTGWATSSVLRVAATRQPADPRPLRLRHPHHRRLRHPHAHAPPIRRRAPPSPPRPPDADAPPIAHTSDSPPRHRRGLLRRRRCRHHHRMPEPPPPFLSTIIVVAFDSLFLPTTTSCRHHRQRRHLPNPGRV